MKSGKLVAIAILVGGVVVSFVLFTPSSAQVTKGKERPMLTKHLMNGLIKVHCGAIGKTVKAEKIDDEAWKTLEMNAALLNEASYILMSDGRCPDGTWANAASKILRNGSADVLTAIEAKDVDATKKAFGGMTKACGMCHKAHKGKKKS